MSLPGGRLSHSSLASGPCLLLSLSSLCSFPQTPLDVASSLSSPSGHPGSFKADLWRKEWPVGGRRRCQMLLLTVDTFHQTSSPLNIFFPLRNDILASFRTAPWCKKRNFKIELWLDVEELQQLLQVQSHLISQVTFFSEGPVWFLLTWGRNRFLIFFSRQICATSNTKEDVGWATLVGEVDLEKESPCPSQSKMES